VRIIQLSSRTEQDWAGKFVDESSFDELLNEDCKVLKPDGSILCVLLKGALSREVVSDGWSVLKDYNASTNNRGIAAGTGYVRNVKQDGTVSKTNRTPPEGIVNSGIIGYFERSVRFPYCRACAWNLQNPKKWASLLPMVRQVSDLYGEHAPEKYSIQKGIVEATSPDFVIPGTVFTTLTVNKNFRTACHKDAGDLPEGISCMSLIREGKFEGAHLVFPDFRVAVRLDTFDLIIFDPHEFHGNTKLIPMSENYTRCSIVYYFRDGIKHCGRADEELARVKNRKAGEPLK
jgi:hypothetical protein